MFNKEEQRKPPTLVLLKENYQHFSANVSTNFASQNAMTFQYQRCLFHNQHFLWGWSKCCCCWLLALCSATCKCISLDNWTCCHTETWMHGPQGQQVVRTLSNQHTTISPTSAQVPESSWPWNQQVWEVALSSCWQLEHCQCCCLMWCDVVVAGLCCWWSWWRWCGSDWEAPQSVTVQSVRTLTGRQQG